MTGMTNSYSVAVISVELLEVVPTRNSCGGSDPSETVTG